MRLEILRGNMQPVIIDDASRILVTTDDGTPVSVASAWTPNTIITSHVADPEHFHRTLARLGIDRTAIVTQILPR